MAKCNGCGEHTYNTHIEVDVKERRNGLDTVGYDTLIFCKACMCQSDGFLRTGQRIECSYSTVK
jgi:hypothetical protein